MTTAHRPTWKAAVGRGNEGGWSAGGAISTQKSALDAPGQLSLKLRSEPVDKKKSLRESLLALEQAESASQKAPKLPPRAIDPALEERSQQRLLKQTAEVDVGKLKEKYNDSDADGGGGVKSDSSASEEEASDLDQDSDGGGDDSSDDDDDDEEALQAELAKIRAEREEAKRQAEAKEDRATEQQDEESALLGNPLLAGAAIGGCSGSGMMKRRWNDDVVFRNQAKGEPKPKKRFINDTVRNDFHKRFLNKFIR